jgi:hypothetical protein
MAMGLRPLSEAAWLEFDDRRVAELQEKERLLVAARPQVVVLAGCDDAARELRDTVREWLTRYRPDQPFLPDDDHPLVTAGRQIQEDLVIVERRDTWRLTGAMVCFPSRWDLPSKAGATLDEIHGPVPGYQDALGSLTNALFDRLTPERSFWRLNWTLLDDPSLFQPRSERRTPEGDLDAWFVRVERQTLCCLPETAAVVFTIRTYVASVAELMARDETFVDTLLTNIESAPVAMQEYKGWRGVADHVRAVRSTRPA